MQELELQKLANKVLLKEKYFFERDKQEYESRLFHWEQSYREIKDDNVKLVSISENLKKELEDLKCQISHDSDVKEHKRSHAPKGYNTWYDYLEYRRSKSDFHILEWDSKTYSTHISPAAQRYYFKRWCDEVMPGGFTEWMRKDIPKWTE